MKNEQFFIQAKNYYTRIQNIQKSFKITKNAFKRYEFELQQRLNDCCSQIKTMLFNKFKRQVTASSKGKANKYDGFQEEIEDFSNKSGVIKQEVIRKYLQMTKFLHTLNLMRWYGQYQMNGKYNSEGMMAIFERIKDQ